MRRALLLVAALATAACSSSSDNDSTPPAGDAGVQDSPDVSCDASPPAATRAACPSSEDYKALEEHSCFHREHGPRKSVEATTAANSAPDVSSAHTEMTVVLPQSCGAHAGVVRYTARKSRPYIVYSDVDPLMSVTAADGRAIAPACAGASLGVCAGLTHATKLSLVEGQTYQLAFGPSASAQVILVIEEIDFEDL